MFLSFHPFLLHANKQEKWNIEEIWTITCSGWQALSARFSTEAKAKELLERYSWCFPVNLPWKFVCDLNYFHNGCVLIFLKEFIEILKKIRIIVNPKQIDEKWCNLQDNMSFMIPILYCEWVNEWMSDCQIFMPPLL